MKLDLSIAEKLYLPKGAYDPIQCEFFNKSSLDAAKKLQYKNESGFPIKGLKHKFTYTLEGKSFKKQWKIGLYKFKHKLKMLWVIHDL